MFLRSTRMRRAATLLACGSLGAALLAGAPAQAQDPEPVSVVEIQVSDRAELDRLVNTAADVTEHVEVRDGDKYVQIVTTDSELALLRAQGFQIGRTVDTETQMKARQRGAERQLRAAADFDGIEQNVAEGEHIKILRADHFTNLATQRFISIEAKTDAGATDALTVRWDSGPGTEMGSGGSTTLDPFVDAGKYLYHRRQISVAARPDKVEVVSSATTERLVGTVEDWAPPTDDTGNPELVDFVDGYLDPTQAYDRIKQLASDYPNLAEIIELPYQTNGYRRKSMAQFGIGSGAGATPGSVVVVESKNYGSEGGDNVKVTLRNPGTASAPLTVNVNRDTIVVDLATNAAGAPVSTAKQVVDAINARSGSPAIAFTYRGSVGDGAVAPAPETRLEDNLNAPAHVSRKPHPMYAIRIGADRSGDKIGVYAYAQEHAREWVGPLVAVETAERLVRNYAVNPDVRELLNNVEVFVLPSSNPDGGHYSFYDFTGQRKNMVDYCDDANGDPARRNQWGVDLNRNYSVGTFFDGYVGGSGSCTSGNFSGPFEYSEPETKNVEWIADTFPNIRFSMNVHSSGNFFMWPPGAYTPERVTLPRPTLGQESYFWGAAGRVVGAIRNWRNLTVEPGQTGPVADVLYSAAGNSGDEFWYENGIYGWDFEIGTSFQPAWPEAHDVAMEFSNGLYELVKIAGDFAADGTAPVSDLDLRPSADGTKVKLKFLADEPATVYYRLDGRRPTYDNATMYVGAGDREGGQTITLDATTTVTWFAVDAAGNVERNYKPDPGSVSNLYRRQVVEVPLAAPAPPPASAPVDVSASVPAAAVTPAVVNRTTAKSKAAKRKAALRKAAKRKAAKRKAAKRRAAQRRAAKRRTR